MVNVDRSLSMLKTRLAPLRHRPDVVTAVAAIAVVAGLSVPAATNPTAVAERAQSAAVAAAKHSAPTSKVTAPTAKQMHPRGIHGAQQRFTPTKAQLKNAKAIVDAGKSMHLPPRAWVIAIGTALQESTLNNFGNLGASNDHDSLGLFQQRPSAGWGSPRQLQNPTYASKAFYKSLVNVPGWNKLPLTAAAQKVQVSAYPNHYAKWEAQAGDLVLAFHGKGPYAKLARSIK